MISIRSGMGLGDSLYLQSVVRYFVGNGHKVEACSVWADVFRPLNEKVKVSPFRRDHIDRLAHYSSRRGNAGSTQFEDCCLQAGINEPVDLRLDWEPVNLDLIARVKASGLPIILVQLPRAPMDRKDGFGSELLPDCSVVQRAIDLIGARAFKVQVGRGDALYKFTGIDLDLANKTSVSDLLDVAFAADGFLGFCSFVVPLSESLQKPSLLVWSRRGLNSPHQLIRQITPKKILHSASSRYVIDDCPDRGLAEAVNALCEQVRTPAVV